MFHLGHAVKITNMTKINFATFKDLFLFERFDNFSILATGARAFFSYILNTVSGIGVFNMHMLELL